MPYSGIPLAVLDARYVNVTGDTMTGALALDDGAGDSPALSLVGGSNDDTANIQLIDDAVAGDSDLAITLAATDDDSRLLIRDSSPATVAYIDGDGNADFIGHVAVGDNANPTANTVLNVADAPTDLAGLLFAIASRVFYSPGANFAATTYGYSGGTQLQTAWTRTGGQLVGIDGFANIANGIDARNVRMRGAHLHIDVEDAGSGGGTGVTQGVACYVETPRVDTGNCGSGYGVQVAQGAVGAGSITNLYGLYVSAINAGGTNYAIYTNAGAVRLGDTVNVVGAGVDIAVDGDRGAGVASYNILTGVTDVPTVDPGWATSSTVDMNPPDGYIKMYVGAQAVVIPYWDT